MTILYIIIAALVGAAINNFIYMPRVFAEGERIGRRKEVAAIKRVQTELADDLPPPCNPVLTSHLAVNAKHGPREHAVMPALVRGRSVCASAE